MHDLKPADVLIERFTAWKAIVRQLTAWFEGIAEIENNTARDMMKLAGVIQVPFRAGNQFLGEGGLQDVFYTIRDKSRIVADHHADLGRTIQGTIVLHLQKLSTEIKAHIKNVQSDTAKLAQNVAKEREVSEKLLGDLANHISTFKNTPGMVQARQDPYLTNAAVARQMQRQVLEENLLQKSLVMTQQNSAAFELGIVRSIQSAWNTFEEWQSRASVQSQALFQSLSAHMASLTPDREWIAFAARSDHLLDPETPMRTTQSVTWPLKDDPCVVSVHTGHLERKKRFTRAYNENYFVLTPAGFLHEFASSDPTTPAGQVPSFSLFLSSCTLGPPSTIKSKSHKFHIEGRKEGTGTTKGGGLRSMIGVSNKEGESNKAWSFRARSRDEMMEWWNDIRMLCARYLVASEQLERSGPVEAAVRSAGYISGGEEEEEEEEAEGSSVEEEEGEGVDEYQDAQEEQRAPPPGYAQGGAGMEMGPHGYPLDKKTSISRRLSRRQEKAPEGRGPREAEAMTSRDVGERPSRDYEEQEQGPTIDRGSYQAPLQAQEGARPVSYQPHEEHAISAEPGVDDGDSGIYATEEEERQHYARLAGTGTTENVATRDTGRVTTNVTGGGGGGADYGAPPPVGYRPQSGAYQQQGATYQPTYQHQQQGSTYPAQPYHPQAATYHPQGSTYPSQGTTHQAPSQPQYTTHSQQGQTYQSQSAPYQAQGTTYPHAAASRGGVASPPRGHSPYATGSPARAASPYHVSGVGVGSPGRVVSPAPSRGRNGAPAPLSSPAHSVSSGAGRQGGVSSPVPSASGRGAASPVPSKSGNGGGGIAAAAARAEVPGRFHEQF